MALELSSKEVWQYIRWWTHDDGATRRQRNRNGGKFKDIAFNYRQVTAPLTWPGDRRCSTSLHRSLFIDIHLSSRVRIPPISSSRLGWLSIERRILTSHGLNHYIFTITSWFYVKYQSSLFIHFSFLVRIFRSAVSENENLKFNILTSSADLSPPPGAPTIIGHRIICNMVVFSFYFQAFILWCWYLWRILSLLSKN